MRLHLRLVLPERAAKAIAGDAAADELAVGPDPVGRIRRDDVAPGATGDRVGDVVLGFHAVVAAAGGDPVAAAAPVHEIAPGEAADPVCALRAAEDVRARRPDPVRADRADRERAGGGEDGQEGDPPHGPEPSGGRSAP